MVKLKTHKTSTTKNDKNIKIKLKGSNLKY